MPVLPLDCHLPTQYTTHTITLQQWTNNKTNKSYKQLIYIYICHVNVTQTVPDISPLMPMHQDPLLVPHLECKYSHLILSKLSWKSAICPRQLPWLRIVLVCSVRSARLATAWLVKSVTYFNRIGLIGGCVREFQHSKYKFSSHPKTLEFTGNCGVKHKPPGSGKHEKCQNYIEENVEIDRGPVMQSFDVFLVYSLHKLLNNSCWWFEMLMWHDCNVYSCFRDHKGQQWQPVSLRTRELHGWWHGVSHQQHQWDDFQ